MADVLLPIVIVGAVVLMVLAAIGWVIVDVLMSDTDRDE